MGRKLLTELIGTFFLVFTVGLVETNGTPLAPIAIGCALIAMVYMGGHVSGAHYNPAITVAMMIRGRCGAKEGAGYIVAQMIGAMLAAYGVYALTGKVFAPAPADGVAIMKAGVAEVTWTFALALVVLNVATAPDVSGNSYYGLAIGLTVTAGAFAAGGISGGAFNPAVGVGPALVKVAVAGGPLTNLGLYIFGPVIGAALAAVVYRMQNGPDAAPATSTR